MIESATLISAFLLGFLGSVHCVGMCGGIVGALTLGLPEPVRQSPWRLLPYLLTYNIGRIASYTFAGAIAGWAGHALISTVFLHQAPAVGGMIGGLFMLALGLYIAGWWRVITLLERAGGQLWRRLEPLGRRFMPARNPAQALILGMVWGWLPCGLVYSALVLAMVAGSLAQGAALMLAFGLGTLPMLLAMGASARWLRDVAQRPIVRQLAGVLIIVFGVNMLLMAGTRFYQVQQADPATLESMPQHHH